MKEEDKNIESFQRYCKDQYTLEDMKTILKWFENKGYDLVRRISMKRCWETLELPEDSENDPYYDPRQVLDQIHHRINVEQSKTKKETSPVFSLQNLYRAFSRAAAILIIPLLIFSVYVYMNQGMPWKDREISYSEVFAPQNSMLKIQLPDGTTAWLNNGSSLKYPQQFAQENRQVQLSGEGYFSVTEDQKRPFLVKTGELRIKVEGTSFNVSAYQDENKIITTVEEGKVVLQRSNKNNQRKNIAELTANMQSAFHKDARLAPVKQVNTKKYTSWKDGRLILDDDPMTIVKKKLERWYNVEIQVVNDKVYEYNYTATFTHESIEQAMKYLSMATPISYEIKMGRPKIASQYSKYHQ
ncbi:MAG: FecR family protein [Bacteroidota bacterium]